MKKVISLACAATASMLALSFAGCNKLTYSEQLTGDWECGNGYLVTFGSDGAYRITFGIPTGMSWTGKFVLDTDDKNHSAHIIWNGPQQRFSQLEYIQGPSDGQMLLVSEKTSDMVDCHRKTLGAAT